MALAQAVLGHHQRHVPPYAYKLQPFFRMTVFSAALSRLRSATNCFNCLFSSSRARNRLASLTSIPPYFDFQLYSVWSVTPISLASSFTGRPDSICFTAPMIFSSLCFAFFIRKTPLSQFGAFQIMSGRDYREQVRYRLHLCARDWNVVSNQFRRICQFRSEIERATPRPTLPDICEGIAGGDASFRVCAVSQ